MDWWNWPSFLIGYATAVVGIVLGYRCYKANEGGGLGWHVVGPMLERLCRRARPKLTSVEPRYTATYESTVSGGGVSRGGNPRDEKVLEQAKHLASRHSELVRLEFNGEPIWTREDGWIGGDDDA